MSRVEDEIIKELHLCAALMSDPLIMLEQSGMVADHFVSAMNKIETLQEFLRPPNHLCERHNWMDSSVLTKGVKRMVSLVLTKHMEPLRWMTPKQLHEAELRNDGMVKTQRNSAPLVFERIFSKDGRKHSRDETLVSREIKEINCMASLVLLHYYLHWHVLLILLNYRTHPCVEGREQEADQRLNVDRLLKRLPGFYDTFELRPIRFLFHVDNNATGDDGIGDESSDDDNSGDENSTKPSLNSERKEDVDPSSASSMSAFDTAVDAMTARVRTLIDSNMYNGYLSSIPDDDLPDGNGHPKENNQNQRESFLMGTFRAVLGMTQNPVMDNKHEIIKLMAVSLGKTIGGVGTMRDNFLQHLPRTRYASKTEV